MVKIRITNGKWEDSVKYEVRKMENGREVVEDSGEVEKRFISKGALKRLADDSYAYCLIEKALL